MKVLTRDDRWLTDVSPINFQAREIVFHEMTITWWYAKAIEQMLKWNNYFVKEETYKVGFSSWVEIYHVWWKWNHFVVEYNSKDERDKNIELLKKNFEMNWNIFSKELEEKRQIPEFQWYFDYEWKYYTILNWLNKLTDETNDNLWVFKWVILNPSKYYWISEISKEVVGEIEGKVDTILY